MRLIFAGPPSSGEWRQVIELTKPDIDPGWERVNRWISICELAKHSSLRGGRARSTMCVCVCVIYEFSWLYKSFINNMSSSFTIYSVFFLLALLLSFFPPRVLFDFERKEEVCCVHVPMVIIWHMLSVSLFFFTLTIFFFSSVWLFCSDNPFCGNICAQFIFVVCFEILFGVMDWS